MIGSVGGHDIGTHDVRANSLTDSPTKPCIGPTFEATRETNVAMTVRRSKENDNLTLIRESFVVCGKLQRCYALLDSVTNATSLLERSENLTTGKVPPRVGDNMRRSTSYPKTVPAENATTQYIG